MLLPADTVPPPSPEAVQSIVEAMDLLEAGNRKEAQRWLQASFRAASPRMMAISELMALDNAIASGKTEVCLTNPMKFDWIHYADAAIKLNLVDQIDNEEMLEAIEIVRSVETSLIERSIELTARYARFGGGNA
jgi:hypothetical protein